MRNFIKEWWGFILFLLTIGGFICFIAYCMIESDRKADLVKTYRGIIIDKGYDPPSSGYKSSSESQYWVVIIDDECHKAVRIHVTPACYYSLDKNNRASFNLSGNNMTSYGNTRNYEHLK